MTENAPAPSPDQRRAEELKNEARRVASTLVVLSGTDCIGIGSYEPAIAAIVQLDADGVNRRARTAEAWRAYIADALIKFAQQHAAALAAQERADAGLRGEADDMAYRFGCLLDHATGARLSKTNYPKEVMYNAVNEYVQRCCDKAVREAREEWEAARAAAERERDDWRSKAKVRADEADALEARAADAERRLGVAREALDLASEVVRLVTDTETPATLGWLFMRPEFAELQRALAALGPAPTPTTPTPKD
jgi:hypothetical protein